MGSGALMEGKGKIFQIVLIVINLLIWIGTIALFVVGALAIGKNPFLKTVFNLNGLSHAAIVIIIVGCFAFLVSFLGCLGAFKESRCMLLTYFIIILVLFILLLTAAILALSFQSQTKDFLQKKMKESLKLYKVGEKYIITTDWDSMQTSFKCCGVTIQDDWLSLSPNKWTTTRRYPKSCCKIDPTTSKPVTNCQRSTSIDIVYNKGCFTKAEDLVKSKAKAIGGIGLFIAFVMLVGLICSILLYLEIKKGQSE